MLSPLAMNVCTCNQNSKLGPSNMYVSKVTKLDRINAFDGFNSQF